MCVEDDLSACWNVPQSHWDDWKAKIVKDYIFTSVTGYLVLLAVSDHGWWWDACDLEPLEANINFLNRK